MAFSVRAKDRSHPFYRTQEVVYNALLRQAQAGHKDAALAIWQSAMFPNGIDFELVEDDDG